MSLAKFKIIIITVDYSSNISYFSIALNLKEIPYDIKPVSLVKSGGEQHSNEFREINPMEQVPALHIDNHTLIESVSIGSLTFTSRLFFKVNNQRFTCS